MIIVELRPGYEARVTLCPTRVDEVIVTTLQPAVLNVRNIIAEKPCDVQQRVVRNYRKLSHIIRFLACPMYMYAVN